MATFHVFYFLDFAGFLVEFVDFLVDFAFVEIVGIAFEDFVAVKDIDFVVAIVEIAATFVVVVVVVAVAAAVCCVLIIIVCSVRFYFSYSERLLSG